MNLRTAFLSAGLCLVTLGATSLPAGAEDGRNAAAAFGAIAGFGAGEAVPQGGYYGPRRAYGGGYRRGDGDDYRRDEGDRRRWAGEGEDGRRRRAWCAYHPGRC